MISALLDINVLLDVFLARAPWLADSAAVLAANQRGEVIGYLSAASIPTIFYIVRRNADLARAQSVVSEFLASFDIVPVDREALVLARSMVGSDFEDNLKIACAVLARLETIVTRDPAGFAASPIPVLTPDQLTAQLKEEAPGTA